MTMTNNRKHPVVGIGNGKRNTSDAFGNSSGAKRERTGGLDDWPIDRADTQSLKAAMSDLAAVATSVVLLQFVAGSCVQNTSGLLVEGCRR
jgi:hypothetical protein